MADTFSHFSANAEVARYLEKCRHENPDIRLEGMKGYAEQLTALHHSLLERVLRHMRVQRLVRAIWSILTGVE